MLERTRVEFFEFSLGQDRNGFLDSRICPALAKRDELGRVNQAGKFVSACWSRLDASPVAQTNASSRATRNNFIPGSFVTVTGAAS